MSNESNHVEWFASWFDSPYYHVLYDHRDENEADVFFKNLLPQIHLNKDARLLDLACGAGRHVRCLRAKGVLADGCDLSPNSIKEAIEKDSFGANFFVHDMRDQLKTNYDAVFNLFTSFGYFDDVSDNLKVLKSVHDALPENGLMVLDFMNAEKVIQDLRNRETIQKQGITFQIQRQVQNGKIVKTIIFEAEGKAHYFQEKVQALTQTDFENLFEIVGFKIEKMYGSYDLSPFNIGLSSRMIFQLRKR